MQKFFLIASLLICLASMNAFAQDPSTSQKTTAVDTERPKTSVDKAVEEAKERGEKVVGTCLVDCGDTAKSQEGDTGHVVELPQPAYPPIARAAHASGTVDVQVLVGFEGDVVAAAVLSGHPLLQAAALNAARKARFTPPKYKGEPVKIVGVIQYHFVAQ
jgi:TonB family protein